ncbi:TetR/AcrR family transcriptional regulator [Virgibacillus siamensis]|uniref:TetR/AcrR family transcriptional regulator n=1 Tax=Virgibacillus siamensis TaxID=480071 RepID=UPI00098491ED|nr:TetR/AcrR family transcriptional regulator [Virgibacillus siamensis]
MNEKKKNIIETAIELFADKGFYATSIEEIAKKSELSKGAFYLHFRSKDELFIEIFKYYHNLIQDKVRDVIDEQSSPRDNFIRQVEVQFHIIMKHRNFILTQLKEQAFTLNKELFELVKAKEYEISQWHKNNFAAIYGEAITPYVHDLGIIYEGIKNRYFQILLSGNVEVDITELAVFIVERIDETAKNLLDSKRPAIITDQKMKAAFADICLPEETKKEVVIDNLLEMQAMLHEFDLEAEKKSELQEVIDYLLQEVKKTDAKEFVIQGLLANFKGISQFDRYREQISEKMQIRLL